MPPATKTGGKPKRGAKASVGKAAVSGGDDIADATAAGKGGDNSTDDKAAGEPVIDPPDPAKDPEGFKEWNPNPIVQKVAIARAFIQAAGQKMDGSALKQLFSQEQMGKLWQIFDGQRKKEGPAAIAKWSELSSKNKGKRAGVGDLKKRCLEVALLGDEKDGTWDDVVATFTTQYSDEHKKAVTDKWKYKGELEQIHGNAEAKEFMRNGKYECRLKPH